MLKGTSKPERRSPERPGSERPGSERPGSERPGSERPGSERPAEEVACELAEALARLHQQTPLWQSFLAVHRQIVEQLADEMLTEHQLPLEWFDVLVHLADLPGRRARQKELRDRVLLSESGVSRMLVRMEQAGVITRSTSGDDRRSMEITMTDAGQAALLSAIDSHLELVASLFTDRLTTTDRVALTRVLHKLLAKPESAHGNRQAR